MVENSHYRVLEVAESASWDEIKESYRTLIRVWHPDRFQNDPILLAKAELKTKELNEAYRSIKEEFVSRGSTHWRGNEQEEEMQKVREELKRPSGERTPEVKRSVLKTTLRTIYWTWIAIWHTFRMFFSFRFALGAIVVLMLMGRPANDRIGDASRTLGRKTYSVVKGVVRFIASARNLEF